MWISIPPHFQAGLAPSTPAAVAGGTTAGLTSAGALAVAAKRSRNLRHPRQPRSQDKSEYQRHIEVSAVGRR
jgi:hypothetical protein